MKNKPQNSLIVFMVTVILAASLPVLARQDARLWLYKDYTSPETGHRVHYATKLSTSFVNTKSGRTAGRITLFSNSAGKMTIEFDLLPNKPGQVPLCAGDCFVTAQFDEGNPLKIQARIFPNDPYALMLAHPADLIQRVKTSGSLKLTVAIKDDGDYDFEFRLAELEWPRDSE
jgi:hypothetical protein